MNGFCLAKLLHPLAFVKAQAKYLGNIVANLV